MPEKEIHSQRPAMLSDAQRLEQSERRYRRLTEALTDYVYRVRVEDGRAVETSHGAHCVDVTGYRPEEFAADPMLWITIVPSCDRETVQRQVDCLLRDHESAPIEHRMECKDGQVRWVLHTLSPELDGDGKLIGYDGLVRDITGRWTAENALREVNATLEQRFAARTAELQEANALLQRTHFTVEKSQDGIFWITEDGGFVYVNEAGCRLSGYQREELLSMSVVDLDADVTPENWPQFWERFCGNEAILVERPMRAKNGQVIPVELSPTHLQFDQHDFVCIFLRDISERKRTEQQLRIKDKAIESAAAGIAISDFDGTISYANPMFARMWGYESGDEMVGRLNSELSSSDEDVGEVMEALHSRGSWVGERVAKKKDGSHFDIEVAASLVGNAEDQPICLMASFIDISERKRSEQRLRESESFSKSILASLTAHIAVIDRSGTIVAVNPAWEEFAQKHDGFPDRCGVGVNYLEVCQHSRGPYSDQAPAVLDGLQRILAGASTRFSIEYPCHSAEERRWFLLNAAPLAGDPAGSVVSHVDITRRRQSEENLRRENEFTENLINTAQNIVLVLDTEGRIVRFNPYLEKLSGWRLLDVLGRDWFETFIPRQDRQGARDLFSSLICGRSTRGNVNSILTRDGRKRETEWYWAQLTDDQGRVIGLLCTGQDITERKALERHVLHIAAEEQRRIGQDLHDGVGQQLTGLGMMADTLLTALKRRSLPECEFAEKLAAGLKNAVGEVRQLARGLNPVEVDPQGLRLALEELAERAEDLYGIRCSFDCDPRLLLRDSETSTQLYRIAQEALNNAAKHAKAKRLGVSLQKSRGMIQLRVVDDGIGIAAGIDEGVGLRSMGYRAGVIGGRLRVEPAEGGGTIVTCSLPESLAD